MHRGEQSAVASREGTRVLVAIGCSEKKLFQSRRVELCNCAYESEAVAGRKQRVLAGDCDVDDVHAGGCT